MFPEELAIRVLKLFSFANSLILDPFVGVGTTAVAAKKLQRHYLGIDISKQYCKTAQQRFKHFLIARLKFTAQPTITSMW